MTFKYRPEFFDPRDIDDAKNIILGFDDLDLAKRWELETEWLRGLFKELNTFSPDSRVLDFGCGIGRVTKVLIEVFGCKVYGYDISPRMLEHAVPYVNDARFHPSYVSPFYRKNAFTHAISIWALQHSVNSTADIIMISECLKPGGDLFVLEMNRKCVPMQPLPSGQAYFDNGEDNRRELFKRFNVVREGKLPLGVARQDIVDASWWALLRKKT